eukprot:COSAG03_NODE_169_length_11255_cov_5.793385_15_plen_69_part_01
MYGGLLFGDDASRQHVAVLLEERQILSAQDPHWGRGRPARASGGTSTHPQQQHQVARALRGYGAGGSAR